MINLHSAVPIILLIMGFIVSGCNSTGSPVNQEPGPPQAVTDLSLTYTLTESLKFDWTQVDDGTGSPASYYIRWGEPGSQWSSKPNEMFLKPEEAGLPGIGSKASYEITDLEPKTTYAVQIVAFRPGEPGVYGQNSGNVNGTTREGPGEGASYRGEILFEEHFKDTNFASRGWYDVRSGAVIRTDNPAPGTNQVLQCRYAKDGQRCAGGYPIRIEIPETESVYLSYWVRYSDNWVGSGRGYHPHEFHFTTNKDHEFVGPANSHLTMYIEQINLTPVIAMQDSKNVDDDCILRNNGEFIGCDGDFDTYEFTEARSVAACNGHHGLLQHRDCYWTGSYWYSSRRWHDETEKVIIPGNWHFVEAYLSMNDIVDGKGVANGSIRYFLNGEPRISSDEILFRTADNSDMAFKYLIFAPWIGDGSPVDQDMRVGQITVARGVKP